jgi:diadenosine tetraphosphate (Ap4A) HIT family hydrolase
MKCELCETDGGSLIWRDADCRVVAIDEPGYPGYCRVIWNGHVKEMTDLPTAGRERLMGVVFAVEAAQREWLRPEKVNLASLGNVIAHLHWHVIPRFRDDPGFPNPIWGATLRPAHARRHAGPEFWAALAAKLGGS